jgi:DNA polymerase-1
MLVDRAARDAAAVDLIKRIALHKKAAQEIAGKPELNPNSVAQLRDLLFEEWKLDPVEYTKLGDPSTNDESIRAMRSAVGQRNPTATAFIDELRKYRRVAKEYGTYVRRLIPYGAPLDGNTFQSEEEEEESERGLIMADGRVRPDYNAHGTTSGRLSSSNPNAQNWPKHLRKLIIPQPGHVIVGADADQLELRIITAIAQIKVYLEAFANKADPHAMTAGLMFGKKFTDLQPKTDLWDKLRKIAKSIKYASFYGSGDETVHGLVTSAEDDNGNLMYPDLTVREVSTLKRNWLKGIPELPKFWDDTMEEFQSSGYVLDPVWGRRRDFLDGEKFNEIINHPIQSAGAHIIHESTFDLLNVIPFFKWGAGTGLIAQVHDALYVEAPCDHAKHEGKDAEFGWCPPGCKCEANRAARDIETAMNRNVKGLDGLTFSAKAKIGKNWGEV